MSQKNKHTNIQGIWFFCFPFMVILSSIKDFDQLIKTILTTKSTIYMQHELNKIWISCFEVLSGLLDFNQNCFFFSVLLLRRHNAHNIIEHFYISSSQMFHIFLFMMVNKVKKLIVNKKIKQKQVVCLYLFCCWFVLFCWDWLKQKYCC